MNQSEKRIRMSFLAPAYRANAEKASVAKKLNAPECIGAPIIAANGRAGLEDAFDPDEQHDHGGEA